MTQDTDFTWATAMSLSSFLKDCQDKCPPLDTRQREEIVERAIGFLRDYYVHLPSKMSLYKIDPIRDLTSLRSSLPALTCDIKFHAELCRIFAELHDLHTQYSLPEAYQTHVALLPFKLGAYAHAGETRYAVTETILSDPPFGIGVEVVSWCDVPIRNAVEAAAARTGGTSEEARLARGLASMTIRPMERQPPPEQPEVTLTYRTLHGDHTLTFPWRVVPVELEQTDRSLARFTNLDHEGEIRRQAAKKAYHPQVVHAEKHAASPVQPYPKSGALKTHYPSIFHARPLPGGAFGYLRIFSFNVPCESPSIERLVDKFVTEFARLIALLPSQGLIIDVRGNGGGFMPMAESILQTLTPKPITPQTLQLRATPDMLALSRSESDLQAYVASLEDAGARYSVGVPMTQQGWCNSIGQTYFGPVLLIIDARCYSATDAFAAGFQDHDIGPILGTSAATGAGGANVWKLSDFPAGSAEAQPLPQGVSLRVALRRTLRVGPNAGVLVEDTGVTPNDTHAVTRRDLLEADHDLLEKAMKMLRSRNAAH